MPHVSAAGLATRVSHAVGTGGDGSTPAGVAQSISVLAVMLLVVDALLLIGNLVHLRVNQPHEAADPVFSSRYWNGNLDGSYPEFFGYIQMVATVVALIYVWRNRRAPVYAVWALVVAAMVADDLLMLHERGGTALVRAFALPPVAGIRPQDLGEITVWGLIAAVLGLMLVVAHLRAPQPDRRQSRTLFALVVALALFAVAIDMLHIVLWSWIPRPAHTAFTLTETTGELVIVTLILLAAHRMAIRPVASVADPTRSDQGM